MTEPEREREFRAPPLGTGERIDKVLTTLMPEVTRATIQRWIGEGRVLVEGKVCRSKDRVASGARITVRPGEDPLSEAAPDPEVPFEVLYDDADLLVVEKPAGVVVHPARGHPTGTLVNGLLAHGGFEVLAAGEDRDPIAHLRPGIVHRIDRDTSGILVVARTSLARERLKEQFSEHSVERVYRALTVGVPSPGRIETLHGRDPKNRLKFSSRVEEGRRAVTHVSVLEKLAGGRSSYIECRLETGRTHQIRVHLSEVCRAPLLADPLYRAPGSGVDPELAEVAEELGRHALHAAVLGFIHPVTGERLRFETPLPADMERALARLRALPRPERSSRR